MIIQDEVSQQLIPTRQIAMTSKSGPNSAPSKWLTFLGGFALLACVVVLVIDLVGWAVVDKHNPITETISKLAIGKYALVQDTGLDIFGVGMIAIAVGFFQWNLGTRKWRIATGIMVLAAGSIFIIAEYNQYKGFDGFGGKVHTACTCVLYICVALAAVILALDLHRIHVRYRWFSLLFAALWLIGGPLFMFVVPTSIDGGVERLLALTLVAWVAMLGWLLLQRGLGRLTHPTRQDPM